MTIAPETAEPDTARPSLPDTRQDLRWVLSAMAPAERRECLDRLAEWVEWLVNEYDLAKQIPRCWYRHRPERNRLLALYVAWVRVYVEPGESQRETALVEWHDALDRTRAKLAFDSECLSVGAHREPPARDPWTTDSNYAAWKGTEETTTADAYHPAPYYAAKPKPTR